MTTDKKLETTGDSSNSRMAGDERRQQIIGVAMEVFSDRGFSGATTREIAAAAGISEAMVFRHFANKDELYSAILDTKACEPLMQNPFANLSESAAERDDFGVFYQLALNVLDHHDSDVDFMRLMLHSALEGHGLAQIFFDRFVTHVYEYVGSYIRQRQRDGDFRDVDPRVVVRAFVGMVVHHSLNNILWDKERKILDIPNEEAAREFATILLNGIKIPDSE
jgi:AcrR family transcriptional regulator